MVVLWLGCCETENFANIWTNDSFIHFIPHSEIICLLVNKSFVFTDRHTKRLLNHFFIIWTCHFVYLFVYTCKVNKQTTGSKNEIQNSFFLVHINYMCVQCHYSINKSKGHFLFLVKKIIIIIMIWIMEKKFIPTHTDSPTEAKEC